MEMNRTKRLSWIVVLIIVAALVAGAYLSAQWIVELRRPVIREAILLPSQPGQTTSPLNNGVIYNDGTTLHALDANGKQIWNSSIGSGASFSVSTGGIAAWNGTYLTLLTDTGASNYGGNLENPILSAKMGTTYVAVQTGTAHQSTMEILDLSGRKIDSFAMENVTVLDYGFFSGGTMFWAMTLNSEGTVPMCTISTYRPGKDFNGKIDETDQILYQVLFQASQIRAVGTTYIKSFDYTGREIAENRDLVYGWYLMGIDEQVDNPLMAFVPISQSSGIPRVNDLRLIRGSEQHAIRLPVSCFRVLVKDNVVYAFSDRYVFSARMGDEKPTAYELPVTADGVLGITDQRSAIITSGDQVFLVALP